MAKRKLFVAVLGFAIASGLAVRAQSTNAAPRTSNLSTNELRLNFRGASLESILNYLSEAAGFIIDLRTSVKGTTTLWSNQPVTREEALQLLNSALDQNGYTAIRNGRTLTIYTKEDAKKRDLPVKVGNKPQEIPKTDEMVTQIVPVRFISATQVAKDLQPLMPERATMTANEGGNALVITDTQAHIRRLTEILSALDTAVASVSSVRVFPLKYADAKALAGVVKDLFQPQDTGRGGNQNQGGQGGNVVNTFQNAGPSGGGFPGGFGGGGGFPGGGGGFPGGFPGGGGGFPGGANLGSGSAASNSSSGGRAPIPRVVAVADERSNSLVVSAPEEQMPLIADIILKVDVNVQDITELRVFRLRNADAQETADLLTELFADSNSSNNNQGNQGFFQFGGGARNTAGTSGQSTRYQKQIKVSAVPDLRTSSVVVTAARELIQEIGKIIANLDADGARKQQVFVFDVPHSDSQSVQDILQSLFPMPTTANNSTRQNSRNQNGVGNQFNNRATQNQNQGQRSGGGSGNSGFGGVGGGVGGGATAFGGQ